MTSQDKPLVSIVVPAHNAQDTLGECLEACLAQSWPNKEIIVVDDGSTDDTAAIAEGAGVRCVRQENAGPAAARNRGAHEAAGELVAFTDADCVPEPDWVERLIAPIDADTAAVGGTYGIANPEHFLARLIHEEVQIRHEGFGETVDFLGSFNMACRKDAFDVAGGFDERFRMASAEDNDLSYRLAEQGTLRFTRDAVVKHYHPERLGPYLRTQMWHGYWRVKLYRKHPAKRRRGDRYAGSGDLIAPPLTVLILVLLAGTMALFPRPLPVAALTCAVAILTFVYASIRLPMAWRLWRRTGERRMLMFYSDMAVLRDLARAAGMLRGLFRFYILGERKQSKAETKS